MAAQAQFRAPHSTAQAQSPSATTRLARQALRAQMLRAPGAFQSAATPSIYQPPEPTGQPTEQLRRLLGNYRGKTMKTTTPYFTLQQVRPQTEQQQPTQIPTITGAEHTPH